VVGIPSESPLWIARRKKAMQEINNVKNPNAALRDEL
jgi:hypothetical protein